MKQKEYYEQLPTQISREGVVFALPEDRVKPSFEKLMKSVEARGYRANRVNEAGNIFSEQELRDLTIADFEEVLDDDNVEDLNIKDTPFARGIIAESANYLRELSAEAVEDGEMFFRIDEDIENVKKRIANIDKNREYNITLTYLNAELETLELAKGQLTHKYNASRGETVEEGMEIRRATAKAHNAMVDAKA